MKSYRNLILLLVIVLLAIGGFSVYWATHSHSVTLIWNASPGATSYNIYRKQVGQEYALIGKSQTTKYVDKRVTVHTAYIYGVKAVQNGQESGFSNEIRAEIP